MTARTYPAVPRVGVGVLVFYKDKILLVKRAQPPSKGKWTVPGGLIKLGETIQEAACREILEECNIQIKLGDIIATFDMILKDELGKVKHHYVIVDLVGEYATGELTAKSDVEDAVWLKPSQVSKYDVPEMTKKLIAMALKNR